MNTELFAYAAGIVDGEGTIGVWREKRRGNSSGYRYKSALEFANTCETVVDFFVKHCGGYKAFYGRVQEHHQDQWKWRCTTSEVASLVSKLRPYLIIKAGQADLVLEFERMKSDYDCRPGKRQDGDALLLMEEFWLRSKQFNKRGSHSQEP